MRQSSFYTFKFCYNKHAYDKLSNTSYKDRFETLICSSPLQHLRESKCYIIYYSNQYSKKKKLKLDIKYLPLLYPCFLFYM